MRQLRWILVACLYLAAELVSPVVAAPAELLGGEAEESIQLSGQRRAARLVAQRGSPAAVEVVSRSRAAVPRSASRLGRAHANPVRKVPAPAPESSSAPEDH